MTVHNEKAGNICHNNQYHDTVHRYGYIMRIGKLDRVSLHAISVIIQVRSTCVTHLGQVR